jgi:mycothiol synthase
MGDGAACLLAGTVLLRYTRRVVLLSTVGHKGATMSLTARSFQTEDDYWRIRGFLREVFRLNDRRERSWQVYRFDCWRWHGVANLDQGPLERRVFLWETAEGDLAAVLNGEGRGQAFLQSHPGLRSKELEEEMIVTAEERLAVLDGQGRRKLHIWAHQDDSLRPSLLQARGYTPGPWPEFQRRRPLSETIPAVPLAPGYTVRALRDDELPGRSWLSWKAFHPDEPDRAYQGWHWYRNVQRAPLYRRDLDLVAVAPGGELASFCTIWFDDVNRTAAFEPVGTHPAHQRRGLGKAVMTEGLRRAQHMGATLAFVGSFEPPAHALYASAGFSEYDLFQRWQTP